MEVNAFIRASVDKFEFLKGDFGFNDIEEDYDTLKPHAAFEKPGLRIQINYRGIESPNHPISMYFITEKKKLFNKFFKTKKICEIDDLLIYRKCPAKVYEYLDYNNIETFYNPMSDEQIEYYNEKYSNEGEEMELLNKYSSLLREYGSDILNGDLNALREVIEFRERNDEEHGCNTFFN
jgi:hypothetical protein